MPAKSADEKPNDAKPGQQTTPGRKAADAERLKKDDRPFFFDDPMV